MDEGIKLFVGDEDRLRKNDRIKILHKPYMGTTYFSNQSSMVINAFPHYIAIEKIEYVPPSTRWTEHWAILDTEGYNWSLDDMIIAGAILLTPSTDIKFLEFPFEIYEKNKKYYILNNVF